MNKRVEKKLEKVLKSLEKEGFMVRKILEIKGTINFLGSAELLASREKYSVEFYKNGEVKLESTWSNQPITKEWLEKASRILNMLEGGFK